MSDIHAHTAAYVADSVIPPAPPPASAAGPLAWARVNLFSSVANGIVTVLTIAIVVWLVAGLVDWAILKAVVSPDEMSRRACFLENQATQLYHMATAQGFGGAEEARILALPMAERVTALSEYLGVDARDVEFEYGACWAVVEERFLQFAFGFYPADERWRPLLAMVLLVVAFAPILFPALPRKMLWFSALYPAVAYFLIWGGAIWGPLLVLLAPVLAYVIYRVLERLVSPLLGILVGVLAAVVWLMFVVGPVDGAMTRYIGEANAAGTQASLEVELEAATDPARKAELEELIADLKLIPAREQQLAAQQEELDAILERRPDLPIVTDAANLPADTPEDVRADVETALRLKQTMRTLEARISSAYDQEGLVGLPKVESAQLGGFLLTLIIGVVGIAASLPIGILLALGRKSNLMIVHTISVMFIEFIRGVPLITLLFVANVLLAYFLPPGTEFDKLLRVLIMVTLFSSAYMAEVIRGGLAALPQGQYEAADALGLDYGQSMRFIVLPQALKISIPGIVNNCIGLFKDTTLVSIIGLYDPIGILAPIRADSAWTGIYWEPFLFVALFFFICCFSMSRYSQHLERKLATDRR